MMTEYSYQTNIPGVSMLAPPIVKKIVTAKYHGHDSSTRFKPKYKAN